MHFSLGPVASFNVEIFVVDFQPSLIPISLLASTTHSSQHWHYCPSTACSRLPAAMSMHARGFALSSCESQRVMSCPVCFLPSPGISWTQSQVGVWLVPWAGNKLPFGAVDSLLIWKKHFSLITTCSHPFAVMFLLVMPRTVSQPQPTKASDGKQEAASVWAKFCIWIFSLKKQKGMDGSFSVRFRWCVAPEAKEVV